MLGGSRQQVVAIRKAKELGYRTVLCDYLPDNPGQHESDVFYQESTTDRDKILKLARRENVSGVLAYSSDPAAPTAGYVAEQLGLPTNPLAAIEVMSQKHLFRAFLSEHGLPCPKAVAFKIGDPAERVLELIGGMSLPLVVKPTDSSGSKGVGFMRDYDQLSDLLAAASRFSRNGVLIAEEYIERVSPEVIGGDIFVIDGEIKFWGLMSCSRDAALGGLVPTGEKLPANITLAQFEKIKHVLQRLVTCLGVRFGELNVEIILGADDTPYVLELGSRAGGNMIPVQLSDASEVDLVSANVRCAMGERVMGLDWSSAESRRMIATYVVHSRESGILDRIVIPETVSDRVYRSVWYKSAGDEVEAFDGANKAIGILFLEFDTMNQMLKCFSDIDERICVCVK